MTETEAEVRKKKIDTRLSSSLLNWNIIPYKAGLEPSRLVNHAVKEYPTASGPADYALFVKGRLLGIIEAKKTAVGAENVLEQAKRYAGDVKKTIGEWRGYKVPFLYSSNGEIIYHLDVRNKVNCSYQISDFHSPQALLDKFYRNFEKAEQWLRKNSVNTITSLRPYQIDAVEAVEKALIEGKKKMLLAMATGTGKTVTAISSIFRLLKSGYAKKILFLVDRRALAAQTVAAMAAFQSPGGLKLNEEYEVYSQRFKREDIDENFTDENFTFNPRVLPEAYLTQPRERHTFIYVSTIQWLAINLLGKGDFDNVEYDVDAHKLDIPIHAFDVIIADECHRGYSAKETGVWKDVLDYFDAVKIGLTATSTAYTLTMFKHKAFSYTTEQAVLDGYLVDYDAVKIKSDIHINGAFLKEGEFVGAIDRITGVEKLDALDDEREFAANEIESIITSPDSTRKIINAVKKYTDLHEKEYGRFPKTLIFAVNDLPHVSHADEVARTCKEVFGKGDDFVMKITGSPTVDRPLQKIRQFRNRHEPKIVVTVDMLTTGVDIPAIEMIVFMRMVKSRILWVQMLGRGTRLCPGINKEKFTIIDCFDGTLIEYFKNATDFDVNLQNDSLSLPEIINRIYNNMDREYYVKILIKRLRRIEKNIGAETNKKLSRYIPEGDLISYTDRLKENLEKNFSESMKLLRNKDFQELLINYTRPKKFFFKGYEIVDTVKDEVMFKVGSGYHKPGDYLKLFETFVKENPMHIGAIEILLCKPGRWNPVALEELRKKLEENDFSEKHLQKAHDHIYKKPLADIISMIKHASDLQAPILTARERVKTAMNKMMESKEFSEEQEIWLGYIKEHLIKNLAIGETDFETMPLFERRGGLGKAKKVFGDDLNTLINQLNEALAA